LAFEEVLAFEEPPLAKIQAVEAEDNQHALIRGNHAFFRDGAMEVT
jgi:hypothetical protein